MNQFVTELHIIGENGIFDSNMEYSIPLYQRAYAWEDTQLIQLIEDINDVAEDTNYYIGSLIVAKHTGKYEVVDGQQRLTSLYLLLHYLGINVKPILTFACREKSNYTLRNIEEILCENRSKLDMDRIEPSILRGLKILNYEIKKPEFDREAFLKKLAKVIVYRIEVPENTDLNRYFEIMNTRGEQLEQHDILKATLMSYLSNDTEKGLFAKIWDACSDMTGYVQMHFSSKNNTIRETLFGPEWTEIPSNDWQKHIAALKIAHQETAGRRICDLIPTDFQVEDDEGYLDDNVRVRFESIIEFPYFLLHTLRVYINLQHITHEDMCEEIAGKQLDDKKLLSTFKRVVSFGVVNNKKISENKREFAQDFILCLLRTRYLFDKYIVKREYANNSADGEWSLKTLHSSKKKPYYKNTRFVKAKQWDSTNDWYTKNNIMLQSALRVSYTSPKVMHWITTLLIWLSEADCCHIQNDDISEFEAITKNIAVEAVKRDFLSLHRNGVYAMGVDTPHIVFNFLDYLLWYKDRNEKKKYSDFVFEFRNSVEHWYPQNPSEGTFERWEDGVDRFGNLCIIQRNINSKFSNLSPEAKKSTFKDMISKGSIKLRIMSDLTEKAGDKAASLCWKEALYKAHEEEMLRLLKSACHME